MSKGIARAVVAPISIVIGKKATRTLLQVVGVVASFIPGGQFVAAAAFIASATLFASKPKSPSVSLSALDRLQASLDPSAPRKMVFGTTAMGTDIRYVEPSGTNQEYIDYIIAVASHKVASIDQIWLEDTLAWSSSGGVQGTYVGYLTVDVRLEGTSANAITINGGTKWSASSARLTGCAYLHLRIKRSGTSSPFTSGLNSRMTVIGNGMPLYDPRFDSTVAGGSGSMRANDQTTWAFTNGQNVALQALAYLLGWRINGKLAVGKGIPPARLDLAGWITAANLCDETVTTATGTQPRYHGAGLLSESDDPEAVLTNFASSCNGRFRESLGQLSLVVMHNDLGLLATDPGLGDDEMIGGFTWNSDPSLEESYNVVRGRFTDPSTNSLYQLVDYPEVALAGGSLDGIERVLTLDLPWVQDAAMAQRIAKQTLERKQYDRTLTVVFNMAGWTYKVGDPVPITLSALGMNRNPMRVEQQIAGFDGTCPMVLRQESTAIYQWDADDRPPVTPAAPIRYDPLNNPVLVALRGVTILEGSVDGTSWHRPPASGDVYLRASNDGGVTFGAAFPIGGDGLLAEGSVDGSTGWALPPSAGDNYIRYSTDGGITWGSPIAITGEDGAPGQYQQLVFKRAATQPATPTGNGIPSGWSDGVPSGTGLIWMSVATQTSGITSGAWSTPAQIKGSDGIGATQLITVGAMTWDGVILDSQTDAAGNSTLNGAYSASVTSGPVSLSAICPDANGTIEDTMIGLRSAPSATFSSAAYDLGGMRWYYNSGTGQFLVDLVVLGTTVATVGWNGTYTYGMRYDPDAGKTSFTYTNPVSGTTTALATATVPTGKSSGIQALSSRKSRISSISFGAAGATGADGFSTAQILLYKRSTSGAPAGPTTTGTYTFSSASISFTGGGANGWTQAIPAGTDPLYVTAATAFANTGTDTIGTGEWASSVLWAQNLTTATATLYKRATSTPAVPASTLTYTFATGVLSGTLSGWSQTWPAGTDPVYIIEATALSTTATDTIATGEWSAPQIIAQNGATGQTGLGTTVITTVGNAHWDGVTVTDSVDDNSWTVSGAYGTPIPGGASFSWITPNPFGVPTDFFCGLSSNPTSSINYTAVDLIAIRFAAQSTGVGTSTSYHTEIFAGGTTFVAVDQPWNGNYIYNVRYVPASGAVTASYTDPSTGTTVIMYTGTVATGKSAGIQMAFAHRGQIYQPAFGAAGADGIAAGGRPLTTIVTGPGTFSAPTALTVNNGDVINVVMFMSMGWSSGGSETVTAQAQYSTNGGGTWTNLGSADSAILSSSNPSDVVSLTPSYTGSGGTKAVQFRVVVTAVGTGTITYSNGRFSAS